MCDSNFILVPWSSNKARTSTPARTLILGTKRPKCSKNVLEFWQKLKVNYKTAFEDRTATPDNYLESRISKAVQRAGSAIKESISTN